MSQIIVIAHVNARAGSEAHVQAELQKLIAPTLEEPGCHHYELHVDVKDPTHFVFYEIWDSVEAHQEHIDSEHMGAFVLSCKGMIAEATINHVSKLS